MKMINFLHHHLMLDLISNNLYQLQQFANELVRLQLNHLSFISIGIIFIAGLLTSLTPCMLSMLPITIGYIGGSENKTKLSAFIQSSWFSLGLATTLAILGIIAASLGKIYGQIGIGLPILVSVIAIIMGLNLLEIIPLTFPTFGGIEWIKDDFPPSIRSFLLGLTFGLVASPCSTPVLATLLAWVANNKDLVFGTVLLLSYAVGYVLPLIIAGTFTANIKEFLEIRRWTSWINPISGSLLLGFGIFSLISRLPLQIL
jgi:cytochrome c-type biogenesis protein